MEKFKRYNALFIRKQDAINNQNAQTFFDLKDILAKIALRIKI